MGLKAMSLFLCHPPSFPVQLTLREVETGTPQCGGDGASLSARGAAGGDASDSLKQQPACGARGAVLSAGPLLGLAAGRGRWRPPRQPIAFSPLRSPTK